MKRIHSPLWVAEVARMHRLNRRRQTRITITLSLLLLIVSVAAAVKLYLQ